MYHSGVFAWVRFAKVSHSTSVGEDCDILLPQFVLTSLFLMSGRGEVAAGILGKLLKGKLERRNRLFGSWGLMRFTRLTVTSKYNHTTTSYLRGGMLSGFPYHALCHFSEHDTEVSGQRSYSNPNIIYAPCYGLNYLPPKSLGWNPKSQCDSIWRNSLYRGNEGQMRV